MAADVDAFGAARMPRGSAVDWGVDGAVLGAGVGTPEVVGLGSNVEAGGGAAASPPVRGPQPDVNRVRLSKPARHAWKSIFGGVGRRVGVAIGKTYR